jgi:sarcosine oxidase subunit alpha
MPEMITVMVNGVRVVVAEGSMVSTAVFVTGAASFRQSVTGEPRGPLCGMGICYECRVTINGQPHCRSCQVLCQNGMDVRTNE